MKEPVVYTQYAEGGTVRMSLHKFDAPFRSTSAPYKFKFKHRVVTKDRNRPHEYDSFFPSCYCFDDEHYNYLKGESGYNEQEIWDGAGVGTKAEKEAAEYIEAAALNWLLEGE